MVVKSAHLTAEEVGYLRELFAANELREVPLLRSRTLALDPYGGDTELLQLLSDAKHLQLKLEQGNYIFDFKLYVERPTAGPPVALRFGYPTIIERDGTARAVRVHPYQGDIRVIDSRGLLQAPQVRDLSATGLSLTDLPSTLTRPGRHSIHLRVQFSNAERFEVKGQVVRINRDHADTNRRTLAIRFENIAAETQTILNRYVFRQHTQAQH
ncbi:PilZ domain-containing protein [Nitrococcus mobilis]|uniref:PilZ domain-containing protein n=1 Tax=Nitrococcus mobilis TaxID=35797 RepID=UPI0002F45BAE|nr:PilZ domain-containing protein [Nitrococcus mobilis]